MTTGQTEAASLIDQLAHLLREGGHEFDRVALEELRMSLQVGEEMTFPLIINGLDGALLLTVADISALPLPEESAEVFSFLLRENASGLTARWGISPEGDTLIAQAVLPMLNQFEADSFYMAVGNLVSLIGEMFGVNNEG
jgi:hypothetical protein